MAVLRPDDKYYTDNDKHIIERMNKFYADSVTLNQTFWAEADIDTRFEAGDQNLWQELYGSLTVNNKKQFNFNRIRRITEMISGHQRKNRKSTIISPVENGDEETADQFTKIMYWMNNQEGILNTISDAFHGAIVTGMNLLQVWVDYRSDPISGDIKVDNCSYNSFLMDPFFKKADLSDCNGIWKRSFLTKTEAASLLPDRDDEIYSLKGTGGNDGKFEFLPESSYHSNSNLLTYDEFYYKDYRSQRMLVDTQTGEAMEWKSQDKEALDEFLRLYPQITAIEQSVPTIKVAIVVQNIVMYDGPNPMGIDSYPFVPVLGYFNPNISTFDKRVQGVVRGLRDAQYLYNRRKIIELNLLESRMTSGWKYKENALVNPRDVFLTGEGRGLALREDAMMSDVEQIIAPDIPPSMFHASDLLGKEIQEISGVNEELLGSAMDDKAGILSMLRQGAGLTTLQSLFDNLDFSQKTLGRIMLNIVQNNFTPGKVKRIISQEPSQQFYHKAFGKYDAAVEEGLNTTTQKQMQFAQLMQLREMGIAIPDETLINASTIQNKKELVESMQKISQSQQQMQHLQVDGALKEQEARTDLAKARAVADQGLGLERLSRIKENQALAVERQAEATKDKTQGMLNLIKALQEIEGTDLAHIEHLFNLMQKSTEQEVSQQANSIQPAKINNVSQESSANVGQAKDINNV